MSIKSLLVTASKWPDFLISMTAAVRSMPRWVLRNSNKGRT